LSSPILIFVVRRVLQNFLKSKPGRNPCMMHSLA
jgi:hypothetical protein